MEIEVTYADEVVAFLYNRMPKEMFDVFKTIWNKRTSGGINWTELVSIHGDRYSVEKALLVLETLGFVTVTSGLNKREKRYVYDGERGIQLAEYYIKIKKNEKKDEMGV